MAVKKSNILGQLHSKQSSLSNVASSARIRAANLADQITELHISAEESDAKAEAINTALDVLYAAGVEV